MKKILLLIFGLMFIYGIANAEVYLLVNKSTNEIKDLSPENDAIIENGFEKIILSGELSDYPLQYHASYYKYQSNKFIVNIKKISDEELAKQQAEENAKAEKLIQEKIREQAIAELKTEGKLDAEGKIVK
jgi:DNA polymerase III epsilon subunit-like protein